MEPPKEQIVLYSDVDNVGTSNVGTWYCAIIGMPNLLWIQGTPCLDVGDRVKITIEKVADALPR